MSLRWLTCVLVVSVPVVTLGGDATDLAFPGAEGAGAVTPGGRGGQVLFVTTLEDRPGQTPLAGSLRAAIEADGPRIVLFRVSGVIELKQGLAVRNPHLTLAGQSAPGDGICLKNFGLSIRDTHDVVIRHLRVRPGDLAGKEQDAISVIGSHRVIIDHCSVSWSTDEALSVTGPNCADITVQWCLIAEGLNSSVHAKGEHGYGSLIRTDGQVSFHHNLYAHFKTRCPRPGTYGETTGQLDFRNNVIYDWIDPPGYSAADPTRMNYIGNYLRPGPSTTDSRTAFDVGGKATALYVEDNIMEGRPVDSPWKLIRKSELAQRLNDPLDFPKVETQSAEIALKRILAHAGATAPRRDAVDRRLIDDVHQKSGRVINSQADVGGWPDFQAAMPPADRDQDGLPDLWETSHGLNPEDATDAAKDKNGNGLPDLEDYLNARTGESSTGR